MNKFFGFCISVTVLFFIVTNYSYAAVSCDSKCAEEALPYVILSDNVYSSAPVPDGWKIIKKYSWYDECEFHWNPLKWGHDIACGLSGFYATHYESEDGQHVLAFRGTSGGIDLLITDIGQMLTGLSVQYGKAIDITENVLSTLDSGDELILTGHSLGGGLASYSSLLTGLKAYTFNPARLSRLNIATTNYNSNAVIKSYIASDQPHKDIVSSLGNSPPNNTDYMVEKPTGWPEFDSLQLHPRIVIRSFLQHYVTWANIPTREPIFFQNPNVSYPGGPPINQQISGMNPGGTITIYVEQKETGYKYSFTRNLSSNGSWSESYYPTLTKPKGTYRWYAKDNTGNTTEIAEYLISDSSSPDPLYGYRGDEIVDSSPVPDCLPDFVAKRAWITKSQNGSDKYVFEAGDKAWINTKIKNEGCADSPQDIKVWYLLSKGEKEDNHHEWVKIGTDTIRDFELPVGQDKWEKEEFAVPTAPGKYNIVACADRIALFDNGDGDVVEEHKSNDCSQETVFTVLPKNEPPVGNFDLANCSSFQGWAKDPNTQSAISIHLYADGPAGSGSYIGSTLANNYRGDLPYTDKYHGFTYSLPDSLNNGVEHQVYAYAIDDAGGTNPLLSGSPKTIKCGLTSDQVAAVFSIIQNVILLDSDGDGVYDDLDNCPFTANSDQLDTDNDGAGNACDDDDDNDGVLDQDDAFPLDPTESVDTDGDGIGNNADPDDDNDGVLDQDDAFPLDPTESVDTDGDGIGNNADPDDDNDGIPDKSDNCPLVANADQLDTDNDGTGDACTPYRFPWELFLPSFMVK